VGPRTGLDDVERKKFLPLQGLELRPLSVVQPVASRHTDCDILVPVRVLEIRNEKTIQINSDRKC
jgi:hypothetical protein